MAPKRHASSSPSAGAKSELATSSTPKTLISSGPTTLKSNSSALEIAQYVLQQYLASTPQRTMLLDGFMGFLGVVAVVQFLYCVLGGNYPFNAFLSGFCAAVGQFVLTASLRMQTSRSSGGAGIGKPSSKGKNARFAGEGGENEGDVVSHERAFADYVFGSLILHFFVVNFIN